MSKTDSLIWVKASERLPENVGEYFVKDYPNTDYERKANCYFDGVYFKTYRGVIIESETTLWLDESPKEDQQPSGALEILTELVALKLYKDKNGKDEHYEKKQPLAWEGAFKLLNIPTPENKVKEDTPIDDEHKIKKP